MHTLLATVLAPTLSQLLAVIVLALGIYGLMAYFMQRKAREGQVVGWSAVESVAVVIAVYIVAQFIVASVFAVLPDKPGNSVTIQFGYSVLWGVLSVGMLAWFMRIRRTPLAAIGVVRPRSRDILYALAGYAVYFVVYAVVLSVLQEVFPTALNWEQKQQLGYTPGSIGGLGLVLAFIGLAVIPPLAEEFIVRGFLFTGLRGALQFLPAALVTGLIFATAHLQIGSGQPLLWVAAIDTFLLSMVLVGLRERTGSLWPGIVVHAIKNTIAFLVLFIF